MLTTNVRTAIFVRESVPYGHTEHICFLDPAQNAPLNKIDPNITVRTNQRVLEFKDPRVWYIELGDEPYKLVPENLIAQKRQYVLMSHLTQNSRPLMEYVLQRSVIQKIWGVGMQEKPIHVFDIELSNQIQLDRSLTIEHNIDVKSAKNGGSSISFISEFDSSIHVGEIQNICSFSIDEFQSTVGLDDYKFS